MSSDGWAICREIRRRQGLSQRALADLANVTPATIARVEKGRMQPSLSLLQRIARAAGVELRWELAQPDRNEERAKRQARQLSDEQRLRQNDALSSVWVNGMKVD